MLEKLTLMIGLAPRKRGEIQAMTGGTITSRVVVHYSNTQYQWYMLQWDGELMSSINQEVFQIHESDKIDIPDSGVYSYHFNLVGNLGSHYINSGVLNMDTWTIVCNKSVCPGK